MQPQHVDLGNPISHLEFYQAALEFAISPHARRRPDTEPMSVNSSPASWEGESLRARDFSQDPLWMHAGHIGETCGAFSAALRSAGGRK